LALAVRVAVNAKDKGFKDYMNEKALPKKKRKIQKGDAGKLKKAFQWLLKKK